MKVVIKATKIELKKEIKDFVEKEISSIERFAQNFFGKNYYDGFFGKGKPKIEAWVEIGKITSHHKKGPCFWAECQMRFPKESIRAEATKDNLKAAIIEVREEIERQIKEYKEKIKEKIERRARKLKEELKISALAKS